MRIRVLLFGPAAIEAGAGEIGVDLGAAACLTAREVLDAIADQHHGLAPFANGGRLAVNGAYAQAEEPLGLSASDELALIAMVSGG